MQLFISYENVDLPLVGPVVNLLQIAGHDAWFKQTVPPVHDWKTEILPHIRACDALVYMLTGESAASEWCQWKFAQAVHMGKPVVPVLLEPQVALRPPLSHLPYADFSQGITPRAIASFMGGMSRISATIPADSLPGAWDDPAVSPAWAG